jgi:DNA mismatch repair protein MutL
VSSTPPLPALPARIALLSPLAIDQIAAGEVVERPASVVKELVDNAIDAGSSRVDVELEEGGLGLIAVRDNGRGIHPDDLLLAVTRHATSKLRDPSELTDIGTLGFRGEALASIAAVARLDLRSRQPGAAVGTHLHARPGEPPRMSPAGMPVGTQVEVHGLFASLPARRKFMRAEATEVGQCSEILLRLAIVHPEVHVTLRHGKRELLNLPRGTLDQRVAQVLARRVSGPLFAFAGEEDGVGVQLWLPAPEAAGRGRGGPYIVVRRRVVRERSVAQIVAQAYGLSGEASACVIIEPPRASVDVNVHPQKSEIRFSDPQRVYAAVRRLLAAAMAAAPWAGRVGVVSEPPREPGRPDEPPQGVAALASPEGLGERAASLPSGAFGVGQRAASLPSGAFGVGQRAASLPSGAFGVGQRAASLPSGAFGVVHGELALRPASVRARWDEEPGDEHIWDEGPQGDMAAGTGDMAAGTGAGAGDMAAGTGAGAGDMAAGTGAGAGDMAVGTGDMAAGTGAGAGDMAAGTGAGAGDMAAGTGAGAGDMAAGTGAGRGGYRLSTRALTPDYDQHKRGVMAEAAALRPASEPPRVEARGSGPAPLRGPTLFTPDQLVTPGPLEDEEEAAAPVVGEASGPVRAELPQLLTCLPGPVAVFAERDALLAIDLRRLRSHLVYLRLQRDLIGRRVVAVQGLLAPAVVRRPAEEVALIVAARAELLSLGVDLDQFGADAVVVRGVPAHLRHCVADADVADLIARIVPWLRMRTREGDRSTVERGLIGAIAATQGSDPAPRLARRWLAELIDAGAALAEVPGLRRWSAAALLAGEGRRAAGREDGAAV